MAQLCGIRTSSKKTMGIKDELPYFLRIYKNLKRGCFLVPDASGIILRGRVK
jgi:hypothetical protein